MHLMINSIVVQPQMYSTTIITVGLIILCLIIGAKVKKLNPENETPKWLIPFVFIVEWINDMCKDNMGKKWKVYAPFFVSLVFFLGCSNFAGIIGLQSPTSYLIVDATLAIVIFLVIQFTGIITQGPIKYLKGFLDPIPLLLPINLIGEITFPVSLALRIMGNIMSGSVINMLITGLGGNILDGWWLIIVLPFINAIFDIFSGFIQVLVFISLSIIFVGMKVDEKNFETSEVIDVQTNN